MKAELRHVISSFLVKMSFLLSVFLFSGFNNSVLAMEREFVQTELIRTEKGPDQECLHLTVNLFNTPYLWGVPILILKIKPSFYHYNVATIVRHCNDSFIELRTTISKSIISINCLSIYPKEESTFL
jgi:hypothetical protein